MPTKNTEAQRLIKILCSCIDELIESWDQDDIANYMIASHLLGCKANYCAIKLRLTTLEGRLPYESQYWSHNSKTKENIPKLFQELQCWKTKAEALKDTINVWTLPIETNVTNDKIEKFIQLAEETIDILRFSRYGENKQLYINGQRLNKLSLELDLIDADWYLAKKCNLLEPYRHAINPLKDKENFLKVYQELGINLNCGKQPFTITNILMQDGYFDKDELQVLVAKTKSLLEIKTVPMPNKPKKITLDDLDDPIKCTIIAAITREKSHNVAAKIKRHDYPVVMSARKNYCEIKHACILWHHKAEAFKNYSRYKNN